MRAFHGVVLDHARADQRSLNHHREGELPAGSGGVSTHKQGGWLSVLFGNDERKLNGHYAVYYVLSMEKGTKCWITVRVGS